MSTLYGREGGGGAPGGVPPSGGAARDARGARRRGGRWVEGTDPFVVAQLFCRFEELPPAAHLPLFSLIVARNAAANGRAVNVRPPPWDVPAASLPRFTQGGRVPLAKHYVDESAAAERENYRFGFYRADRARIDGMVARAATREEGYYRDTDAWLYAALERHGGLAGREAVVMGSLEPWYESVALALGAARVTTIEYNRLQFDHPQLRSFTCAAPARARPRPPRPPAPARARPRPPAPAFAPRPPLRRARPRAPPRTRAPRGAGAEYEALDPRPRFDVALSISSFEHDGAPCLRSHSALGTILGQPRFSRPRRSRAAARAQRGALKARAAGVCSQD